MQTSYAYTKSADIRQPNNPNDCINANAECQDEYTDYSFKLNGSFELPAGIKMSPVYRFQSGNNYQRTFVATLNYANPTLDATLRDAHRTANVNLIDLRFDKGITLGNGRLSPFLDIYNIFNANAEQNITNTSGSSWLRPINIIPPRVMRIGVKYDW